MIKEIVEVKTIRTKSGLEPKIQWVRGFNYSALKYSADKKTCIVRIWCSDSGELSKDDRKTQAQLNSLITGMDTENVLTSHSKDKGGYGYYRANKTAIDEVKKAVEI